MTPNQHSSLVQVILDRLDEGEGAIYSEFVVGQEEADNLHREFDEARDALRSLLEQLGAVQQDHEAMTKRLRERRDKYAALQEQFEALRVGLEELLSVAERIRGGDTKLDPEEWYAARDYARHVLASSPATSSEPSNRQRSHLNVGLSNQDAGTHEGGSDVSSPASSLGAVGWDGKTPIIDSKTGKQIRIPDPASEPREDV